MLAEVSYTTDTCPMQVRDAWLLDKVNVVSVFSCLDKECFLLNTVYSEKVHRACSCLNAHIRFIKFNFLVHRHASLTFEIPFYVD